MSLHFNPKSPKGTSVVLHILYDGGFGRGGEGVEGWLRHLWSFYDGNKKHPNITQCLVTDSSTNPSVFPTAPRVSYSSIFRALSTFCAPIRFNTALRKQEMRSYHLITAGALTLSRSLPQFLMTPGSWAVPKDNGEKGKIID